MFIFNAIMFNIIDDVDEWMYFLVLGCVIVPTILIILNLFFNRKNTTDLKKKRLKTVIFFLGILTEFIIILIPLIVNRININNIDRTINVLKNDLNRKMIVESNSSNTAIFDNNGNRLVTLKYSSSSLNICDIVISNENNVKQTDQTITILTIEDYNGTWMIDYKGNKIARLYTLFDNRYLGNYYFAKMGYNVKSDRTEYITTLLKLKDKNNNTYKFGDFEVDGYQILVEFDKNKTEDDLELYRGILDYSNNNMFLTNYEKLEDIYKFKKNYYIINKNGESKKLECNNLIFTFDMDDNLAIKQYSNYNIPYYDDDSTGYFDTNGTKFSFNKNYLIVDTTNKYAIIDNKKNFNRYIYFFENKNVEQSEDFRDIQFYDDDFFATYYSFYKIKDNELIQLNDKDDSWLEYKHINYDTNRNIKHILPYDDIYIKDYSTEEITSNDLIYKD